MGEESLSAVWPRVRLEVGSSPPNKIIVVVVVVALLLQNKPTVSNGWRIVVVGEAKLTTVSKMRFVVGQGLALRGTHFTKARASK